MTRSVSVIFIPGGIFFLAAAILAGSGLAAEMPPAFTGLLPYGIWTAGILLAWRFNRSRLVFALLVLAMADRALWHTAGSPELWGLVPAAAAVLVPLNLAVIFLLRERGILEGRGRWRLLFLVGQPAAAAWLILFRPAETERWLHYQVLPATLPGEALLPQLALLTFGGVLFLFWIMLLRRRRALENGFFWGTVAAAGAFAVPPGPLSMMFLNVAGMILMVALIEAAYGMAFLDDLTGLPARRALNEALLRLDHPYTLAMLDIDHFKEFNDRYGHDVGDQVLRMVAIKLDGITGGGKPFRYGGEEFTILFPGKTRAEALPHLEEVRKVIAGTRFVIRGKNRTRVKPAGDKMIKGSNRRAIITVSIGVAADGGRPSVPQKVLRMADQALYRAKNNGRNQVAS